MGTSAPPVYHLDAVHVRYSSWSARAFIILHYYSTLPNPPFTITTRWLNLGRDKPLPTPSNLVPVLTIPVKSFYPDSTDTESTTVINDSLAICEVLNELHPELHIWPSDPLLRARARVAAAEMHSGFLSTRTHCSSNYWGYFPKHFKSLSTTDREAVMKDMRRIAKIWDEARQLVEEKAAKGEVSDDGWLFGEFGAADAMYMPILWRVRSYDIPVVELWSERVKAWVRKMWAEERTNLLGHMKEELSKPEETDEPAYEALVEGRESVPVDWECKY